MFYRSYQRYIIYGSMTAPVRSGQANQGRSQIYDLELPPCLSRRCVAGSGEQDAGELIALLSDNILNLYNTLLKKNSTFLFKISMFFLKIFLIPVRI